MIRPRRARAGRHRWAPTLAVAAAFLLVSPDAARAQSAATVSPTDPVYADLERLEAFGLVPRGAGASGPWSVARIAWMVSEAKDLAEAGDFPMPRRDDIAALITRVAGRFPSSNAQRAMGSFEMEGGGGRSPDRVAPDNGLGRRDAVVNPLWTGRGGRAYGDRGTAAAGVRVAVPLSAYVALIAGGSRSWTRSSDDISQSHPAALEALSLRARLGSVYLDVGRDRVWAGDGSPRELALSGNGPALDMIRVGTDRPLSVPLLGELDLTLFATDLGGTQVPAHAKLFGFMATSRPTPALELAVTVLNKQLGEGAPEASLSERLRDLTLVLDWLRPGVSEFSDKLANVYVSLRPAEGAVFLFAEAVLTDFDHRRLHHTFQSTAGYRLGAALPRLGASGRHEVGLEAGWMGPDVYLHHQYRSGHAAGGFPLGSYLDPDSRSLRVSYGYHPSARGWWGAMGMTVDEWRGDTWGHAGEGQDGIRRLVDGPDEIRLRGEVNVHKAMAEGRAGVDVAIGFERVRGFAFDPAQSRVNSLLSVRFWHAL